MRSLNDVVTAVLDKLLKAKKLDTKEAHPLDGADERDCYDTMMKERAVIDAARREAENGLIKNIITLATALIGVLGGYIGPKSGVLSFFDTVLFSTTLICLVIAVISGLFENYFSGKAAEEQQRHLEAYYTRRINIVPFVIFNAYVRRSQLISFISFVSGLALLALLSVVLARKNTSVAKAEPAAAASSTAASPSSTSTSPAAGNQKFRREGKRGHPDQIGGTNDAAGSTAKGQVGNPRLSYRL